MKIGWIGTGVMGASMCGHILAKGYAVTLYTRTRAKAQPLVERGASWADSPRAAADASDVVFTMLGFPAEVRAVYLGDGSGDSGLATHARAGQILVDMSTSEPALAREIADAAAARGAFAVDAPVSGGDIGAREARLSIMVGGDEATIAALDPLWSAMGKTVVRQGGPGAGQHTKMVNQILIATGMIGVCEALLYAHAAGLDPERVLQSVASGAAGSWSLSNYGPRILAGNFEPGFFVEHFIKDMAIALDEARRLGLSLPGLGLAQQLYQSVRALGYGKKGTHALQLALAAMSGIDWKARAGTGA
jgi:3-hydroxyisobutyrate dehydrogenase